MIAIYLIVILAITGWSEPILVSELGPGEGGAHFASTGHELELRAKPNRESKVVRIYRLPRGRRIIWDKTEYQTISAATVRVRRAVTLNWRPLGNLKRLTRDHYYFSEGQVRAQSLQPGEQFEYLQYRAEGACIIKIGSKIAEVDLCTWLDNKDDSFEPSGKPKTEWWIRITEKKRPLGWLLLEDAPVKTLRRSF